MKKFSLFTLSLFSLISICAQVTPFNQFYAAVSRDYSVGSITVDYTEFHNTGGCLEEFVNPIITFRKHSSATDQIVYHHSNAAAENPSSAKDFSEYQKLTVIAGRNGNDRIQRIVFKNLPIDFFNVGVEVRVKGTWRQNSPGCGSSQTVDRVLNQLNGGYDNVNNVTATDGTNCDGIRLTWTNPAQAVGSLHRTDILRTGDGNSVTLQAGPQATAYFDNTAQSGINYTYNIKSAQHWVNVAPNRFLRASGVNITASRFAPTEQANGIYIDQVNCNGDLEVNWNWSGTSNPNNFQIQRASDSIFTSLDTTFTTGGTSRSFRDLSAVSGEKYFYRVVALVPCPNNSNVNVSSIPTGSIKQVGNGIPPSTVLSSIVVDTVGKNITLKWVDNTNLEDGFKIVRSSATAQVEFDVSADDTVYVDNSALTCTNYTYQLKTYNDCKNNGVLSTNSLTTYIPSDLGTTFDANNFVKATDGEFGDRIDIKWKTSNRQIDFWNIFRINPLLSDTVQIASVDGRTKIFTDRTANANAFYKYLIQGENDCAGNLVLSNTSEDFGFRLSFGTVNGQVTYTGGVAVDGVKITADPSSGASGKTGLFNGTTSFSAANHTDLLAVKDSFTVQAYVNPANLNGTQTILSKSNATQGYRLQLVGNQIQLWINGQNFTASHANVQPQQWFSVSASVASDSVFIYTNNNLIGSFANTVNVIDTSSQILIGKSFSGEFFEGNLDDIRFYDRPLTNREILQSYDVYINPSSKGLVGYWRYDEGFGSTAYDYSKTLLTPNKNHAANTAIVYSNNKPSTTQLTAGAYTDDRGSYFIPFIPYLGSGDNFILTPQFGTHSFSPATTTLLIGTGSENYTGQDFIDNSSFSVSGTVKYANTNCFVKDARLLIDGEVVIRNGQLVTTDANGVFDIQVPIGPHVVTVEKTSHVFSAGRFPSLGAHDFQQNVQGINFIDSTLVKVVGRVAGGGIQKDLPPALALGKNNIGQARIPFKAQQGNGCLVDSVTTNTATGEYVINLPPIKYEVPNFSIGSNLSIAFNNNSLLDVSIVPPVQHAIDSVFSDSLGFQRFVRVDSASYQRQLDYIYNSSPQIDVTGKENPNIYGADSLIFEDGQIEVKIPATSLGNNYPFFYENKSYKWNISAFEIYENRDNGNPGILDSVPMVEGRILIQNNLSSSPGEEFEYNIADSIKFDGIQEYEFSAGQANTTENSLDPNKNFTKTCEVTLLPKSGNAVSWKVNGEDFRGIIFGGKALGNAFSTSGPDVVTMILRDPPGTESSASWESGTTITSVKSWENTGGIGADLNKNLSLGTSFTIGLGYETATDIDNDLNFGTKIETSISGGGELVEERTTSVQISTGSNEEFVGANADLFFGKAMNMDFGLSEILTMVNLNNCGGNGSCYGGTITHNNEQYRLGITNSMFAVPQGYETEFVYTQAGIENIVIPRLEGLRNNLLNGSNPKYVSFLPASDDDFGKSNDNLDLANPTPDDLDNSAIDSLGLSYYFKGYRTVDTTILDTVGFAVIPRQMTVTLGIDSVWWYNKQISLWEDALAQNEKAKVQANTPQRNISFQGGNSISYTENSTRTESSSISVNFNLTEEITLKMGLKLGGAGVDFEQGISMSYSHQSSFVNGESKSTTFSYNLADNDDDDDFSVDVFQPKDGFGPIFKTRAGQTSCPYQGETVTKYYQPGTIIDQATIQLEQPRITASPSNLFNVPANAVGNITLNLINDGLEDNVYSLKVLESSNPNGAILKIDGISPNRGFAVPAKTSISKTITIERGPNHISYDSIALIFHSQCQFAFGTAGYDDIADTVYISVNFLPSCTELNITAPQNQYVVNTTFNDNLPVLISGYDINYSGLEKIALQYKPSNQASWVPLETEWFFDTSGVDLRYPNHSDPQVIPKNQSYITYNLNLEQLIDQNYDLRAISTCQIPFNPDFSQESSVISGVVDRVNPHPFGSPTPADGVLDPNDDISIRFNEVIEAGSLTPNNFQITGVLNGQELRHDKAVAFNGVNGDMEIDNGFDFATGDFTIEFWAKRKGLGKLQTIISQGSTSANNFRIAFDANDQVLVEIGANSYTSSFSIVDTLLWHHYAITYNRANLDLEITERLSGGSQNSINNNFFSNYTGSGKTFVGKNGLNQGDYYEGSMHQLRIWNRALNAPEVASRINQNLTGREAGLIGYWPMDEGRGLIAEDKARFRHAEMNADWEINPKSTSLTLNSATNDFVSVDSAGTLAINPEMDFTIEFWFKTAGGQLQTMFSNGSGLFAVGDLNRNGWNIEMNAANEIWIKNDSVAFLAATKNFGDDNWHHLALVVNRLANATLFVDGEQQNSMPATNFWGFGGAKLSIGSRYSLNGVIELRDQYFTGNIDEVRVWNKALLREAIELDRYNRLKGDEFGLLAYYPFESYRLELGVPILDTSLNNQSNIMPQPARLNARAYGSADYDAKSPAIALQRPVEQIKYSWSVNNDAIVITPNEDASNIENVTLNVSVQGVRDLQGNVMQSPKTWIAFVNKNQIIWQDIEKNLAKEFNDTMTFRTRIVNSGGEQKSFSITNLPSWLTATPSSGTINPLSTTSVEFTVNPNINIGDYSEDILLTTDFGFAEKLFVQLKVRKTAPAFNFNSSQFNKSMSVIGQISINGTVSTNNEDILVAYVNGQIRGKAQLQYMPSLDRFMAFLDVFGDNADSVYFKVWNSREGELHEEVSPSLSFTENAITGTILNPQIFNAVNKVSKPIALQQGWNWVSFPLTDEKMGALDNFTQNVNFETGDAIKTRGNNANATYDKPSNSWVGPLSNTGLENEKSYLIYISNADTINYSGFQIDPDTVTISTVAGWNRIGFVSLKNMSVNTAMANYAATDGDLIKSQQAFAVYQNPLGWIGSLQAMEPTEGYLLKSASGGNFNFPRRGLLRLKSAIVQPKLEANFTNDLQVNPAKFEASTSAIIELDICEEITKNEDWMLLARENGELRGLTNKSILISAESTPAYYLTVFGNNQENYQLSLFNTTSKEVIELESELNFIKNDVQGSPNNPLVIKTTKDVDCDRFKTDELTVGNNIAYPNPFTNELTVQLPKEFQEKARIEIMDLFGKQVYSNLVSEQESLSLKGSFIKSLKSGTYYLRVTNNDAVKVVKIVKVK